MRAPERRRVWTLVVALGVPSVAWADAWDEDLVALRAAQESSDPAANANAQTQGLEAGPRAAEQLPICQPWLPRCDGLTQALSTAEPESALGLPVRSELQWRVETRWTPHAVPRRQGGPRAWTATKAKHAHRRGRRG